MERFQEVFTFLPVRIREYLNTDREVVAKCRNKRLSEIRLRVKSPLILMFGREEMVCSQLIVSITDIRQCLQFISDYSLYAHEEDVGKGFITLRGGHRAGLVGQAIIKDGKVINQNNIGFINIRVAYEVKGCADGIMSFVEGESGLEHTLIISPPACGKTTLLRDIIRQLSAGIHKNTYKVGIVDERSEIAACFEGVPQNDIGPRSDVVNQIDKASGMMMLLRSMSPDVIAVDELAGEKDTNVVKNLFGCGCKVIATVHGKDYENVKRQPYVGDLIGEYGFRRIIVLGQDNEFKELRKV